MITTVVMEQMKEKNVMPNIKLAVLKNSPAKTLSASENNTDVMGRMIVEITQMKLDVVRSDPSASENLI